MTRKTVAVLGAGIIGVSTALCLQKLGYKVTLIDRKAPASETSYGNAGMVTQSGAVTLANPSIFSSLPSLLSKQSIGFQYDNRYALKHARSLSSFLLNAKDSASRKRAKVIKVLSKRSQELHRQWLNDAGETNRIINKGWLKIYRDHKTFEKASYERSIYDENDINYRIIEKNELHELETTLKPIFQKGVLIEDSFSLNNPAECIHAYVRLFVEAGGTFKQEDIQQLATSENNVSINHTQYDQCVITLGPWSNEILAQINTKLPLFNERGTHYQFAPFGLTYPIYDIDMGFVATPMEPYTRMTTGVTLCEMNTPLDESIQKRYLVAMQEAFNQPLERIDNWIGHRPTLKDSLPAIGQLQQHKRVWLNTGHQHIGLLTGCASGELLASLIANNALYPQSVIRALDPQRFAV